MNWMFSILKFDGEETRELTLMEFYEGILKVRVCDDELTNMIIKILGLKKIEKVYPAY